MADNPAMNAPAGGTYGEQTALQNLKKALPVGAMGNPAPAPNQPTPSPSPPMAMGGPPQGKPGIPSVLTQPQQMPQMPSGPTQGAPTPDQGRLSFLYAVASSPQVSPQTREWAQILIGHLVAPGTAYDLTQQQQGPPQPGSAPPAAPPGR